MSMQTVMILLSIMWFIPFLIMKEPHYVIITNIFVAASLIAGMIEKRDK